MKKTIYAAAIAVLAVLCILCVVWLVRGGNAVPETEQSVQDAVIEAYQPATPEPTEKAAETPEPEETAEPEEPYVSPIDFASLQAENPEIYAWLYIPNTDINYPLLQHDGDDAYYLNRDSEGNSNSNGALFTEHTYNGTDFTDPVTVVYGHHMRSGAMFGNLQAIYSEPDGITDCGEIVVYLPDRELHFAVWAAVPYDNRHILYNFHFENEWAYNAFLNSVSSVREIDAVYSDEVTVSTEDQLLILSTCLKGNSQKRYLVLAKRVDG